ncbi:MAG: hypothetical protein ACC652_02170, partial [Acidimicrobiales bacterium]
YVMGLIRQSFERQMGNGDLGDTVTRGLEVAAWVVLWFPIDLLVFAAWQFRLDGRAYRIVHDMEIRLTAS